jgi:gliding motility-associated-like protein
VIVIITEPSDIQITSLTSNVSCFGDINGSAALQISGGVAPYFQTWFGIDSSFLAPGTYPYQVVDNNNCVKNGNVTIYEPDTLRASASIVDVDCYGDNNGVVNLNITGGTAPYASDFGSFNQYTLSAGTYPFTITDINGCKFDSTAIVNQANQIFLDFIATSPICRYDESTLSIHISNSTSNIYTMLLEDSILKSFVIDTNGFLIPEEVPIILTPNFSGEVSIISLTDNNGCEGVFNDDVHIEVKQLPVLNLNENDICVGEPSYTLSNATPLGGTYFINDEMTDYFDVENLEADGHIIRYEYTDPITSCYNEIEEIITIIESPEAGLLFSPQPTDINDPNIFFRDNSNDMLSSVWDLGDGTIIYDDLSFWHTYSDTGTYLIKYYITNQYNCTDSVIENLVINPVFNTYIPTAFTPNDDGDNDYFYPSVTGSHNYNMKIYNRWGGIIYNEDNGKWNGTQNDKMINNGLYVYSILIYDFKNKPFIYTGLVTLVK